MKLLIVLAVTGSVFAGSFSSRQIGNTTYNSDGTSSRKVGNSIYTNDGTSYRQVGNTTYGSDGSSSTQIGNIRYYNHADGGQTTEQTIGNTKFYSGEINGTSQKIGNTRFYNLND